MFMCRAKWLEIDGIKFKKEAIIVYEINEDLPKVAKILNICY